jgi:hypothetical protein
MYREPSSNILKRKVECENIQENTGLPDLDVVGGDVFEEVAISLPDDVLRPNDITLDFQTGSNRHQCGKHFEVVIEDNGRDSWRRGASVHSGKSIPEGHVSPK